MAQKKLQAAKTDASSRRLINCISVLFVLLSALGLSSYWLLNADAQQPIAITIHSLLLVSAFFLVVIIATRNQNLQNEEANQRNRKQNILYDVAASINTCRDLSELLNRFCDAMFTAIDANSISIWLITDTNLLEYVASTGLSPELLKNHHVITMDSRLNALFTKHKIINNDEQLTSALLCQSGQKQCYLIPLHYQGKILGVLAVDSSTKTFKSPIHFEELLVILGKHLSMAIEKARLDQESKRMIIMQERSLIANELHDSLAQTLASLRFQVRVLDETLQPNSDFKAIRGIEQVENSLDEAYSDLRELIAHCRTPINKQGLIPAIEKLISRFRKETGMHVLFQKEWHNSDLPPNMEMHIFRIVQEAMNNIRKHSGANNVRVMFRCNETGNHHILIENDGVGFETPSSSDHPGKHLGLTIMQERAAHLGGKLRIESDLEEGTRIELQFTFNNESKNDPLQRLSGISR